MGRFRQLRIRWDGMGKDPGEGRWWIRRKYTRWSGCDQDRWNVPVNNRAVLPPEPNSRN